jgi:hypothetical protein
MELLIKVLGTEEVLSPTQNTTVNNAVVVRLVHIGSQEHVVIIQDENGTNIANVTILNNSEVVLEKDREHALLVDSGSDVKVVAIAYKN